MAKKYRIVEPVEWREYGMCAKCGKSRPVVKVMEIQTGRTEWRCREHVYYLENGRKVAHKLADINIERMSREKKRPEG